MNTRERERFRRLSQAGCRAIGWLMRARGVGAKDMRLLNVTQTDNNAEALAIAPIGWTTWC